MNEVVNVNGPEDEDGENFGYLPDLGPGSNEAFEEEFERFMGNSTEDNNEQETS